MLRLLSEAGRSFLRAFGGSLIVFLPGLLSAPDFNGTVALGIAALVASIAAGLKAIQVFVPQLSFATLLPGAAKVYAYIVDSFARAFIAAFITGSLGLLAMPELSLSRSLVVGVIVAAVTAGIRAVQGSLTKGDVPSSQSGLDVGGVK